SLTKADVFGVKFERNVIEKVTTELAELLRKDVGRNAQTFSEAAVARAVHSAEAIVGANLLWVDDNPSNNARLVEILETLRIRVSVVGSTEEALAAMELLPFDVVVSDIWRKNDIGKAPECVNLFWTANFQIA
ncbi:MAG: hypothetical protein KDB90_17880, partial [Planctomycetes bacterium]|nr:hypothetical protein [Planctomycetota bacterium]